MQACIKLRNYFIEVCNQCAKDYETNSANNMQSIQSFSKSSEVCATECEKHDNAACKKCAETCRACVKEYKSVAA